jgi:hypothetical protein
MLRKWVVAAALASMGLSGPASAWGPGGHEQIADIAWVKLAPEVREKLGVILGKGHLPFRPASATDMNSVRRMFRRGSTFPDVIKGDTTTIFEPLVLSINNKFGAETDPDVGERERKRCKSFHYLDTPLFVKAGEPEPRVPPSNALNALGMARAELAQLVQNNGDKSTQCWWVYWIEHLVGDLHQPLHCAESFRGFPHGDDGGNLFNIKPPGGASGTMRLHAFWDGGIDRAIELGEQVGLSVRDEAVSDRWMADAALAPSGTAAANLNVQSWITAGAELAKEHVYTGIRKNRRPSQAYINTHVHLCKQQAVLGGFRLASVLNEILGQ